MFPGCWRRKKPQSSLKYSKYLLNFKSDELFYKTMEHHHCNYLPLHLFLSHAQSRELRTEKATISDRVACRSRHPRTESYAAHYFQGKY